MIIHPTTLFQCVSCVLTCPYMGDVQQLFLDNVTLSNTESGILHGLENTWLFRKLGANTLWDFGRGGNFGDEPKSSRDFRQFPFLSTLFPYVMLV